MSNSERLVDTRIPTLKFERSEMYQACSKLIENGYTPDQLRVYLGKKYPLLLAPGNAEKTGNYSDKICLKKQQRSVPL